jgi:HPt (histidine-containing phosphotransfer) domain-containing protein
VQPQETFPNINRKSERKTARKREISLPAEPPALPALICPRQVADLCGLDADESGFFMSLVEIFREKAGRDLLEMRASAARGDARATARAAHALRGSAGSIGAERLEVLCEKQEERGRQGDMEGARGAMTELALCLSETLLALKARAAAASDLSSPLSVAG